ncbi:hypothetical protein SARC_03011 [Sphaeroforma arctica JP610]|uniref:Uncharacterized protein n=1 Tax=Sphaeroforma arctica JP610 TaxID=667725 RepID=A0A0L0G773_9EUKA|nr:hypothetical protein SARC_03011 [Sphaeroforma arctica JP610]KNC84769.1 hypothetical protein SARC_03011 [Sphaeroforma arctica JP610]|eukprot:XP_014158671.1 hypothetical protein SARC_03011 [Sphaeroforma arctica JP610]
MIISILIAPRTSLTELNQYKLRVRLKEQGSGIKELTLKTFNATDLNVTDIPIPVQGLLPALRLKRMYEDGVLYDHHDLPFTPDATGKVFNASTPTFDNRLFAESVQKLRPGAQPVVFSYLIDENQRVHMLLYGRTILVSADDNQVTPLVSLHTMPSEDAHAPLKASLSTMSNAEMSSIRANAIVNPSSANGETSKATSADSAVHSSHKPPPSRPHNVLFGLIFVETFLVLLLFSLYWDAWSTINTQQARLAAYGAGGEAVCKYLYSDTSGG